MQACKQAGKYQRKLNKNKKYNTAISKEEGQRKMWQRLITHEFKKLDCVNLRGCHYGI